MTMGSANLQPTAQSLMTTQCAPESQVESAPVLVVSLLLQGATAELLQGYPPNSRIWVTGPGSGGECLKNFGSSLNKLGNLKDLITGNLSATITQWLKETDGLFDFGK